VRRVLLAIIVLESALLAGGASMALFGGLERFQRVPPAPPVFRPPLHDAVIGDLVRYERRDRKTGAVIGTLEYEVMYAVVTKGTTLGPEFIVRITRAEGDQSHERLIRIRPRAVSHGFLPPRFEEDDDYPTGARPIVKTIRSGLIPRPTGEMERYEQRRKTEPDLEPPPRKRGFLVEAVTPRESLTEVKERYWITPDVPLFGVARWERGDELLELLHAEHGGKR